MGTLQADPPQGRDGGENRLPHAHATCDVASQHHCLFSLLKARLPPPLRAARRKGLLSGPLKHRQKKCQHWIPRHMCRAPGIWVTCPMYNGPVFTQGPRNPSLWGHQKPPWLHHAPFPPPPPAALPTHPACWAPRLLPAPRLHAGVQPAHHSSRGPPENPTVPQLPLSCDYFFNFFPPASFPGDFTSAGLYTNVAVQPWTRLWVRTRRSPWPGTAAEGRPAPSTNEPRQPLLLWITCSAQPHTWPRWPQVDTEHWESWANPQSH